VGAAVAQVRRGLAVAVDYGHVLHDRGTWGDRRPTLTGWRDGRPVHAIPDGTCDLTAHVALDSLHGRLLSQQEALRLLGVRATPPPRALSKTDPRGYLAQLARRRPPPSCSTARARRVRLGGRPGRHRRPAPRLRG
jgi:hypothetical protein